MTRKELIESNEYLESLIGNLLWNLHGGGILRPKKFDVMAKKIVSDIAFMPVLSELISLSQSELQLKYDELLKKQEWISVEDRLPESMSDVIFAANDICSPNGKLLAPMTSAGWYNNGFYSWLSKEKLKATHWLPMPVIKNGQ